MTEDPDVFRLVRFDPDVDYCDAQRELWIWSIGRSKKDGNIYATFDGRYYLNEEYECLWLR